MVTCTGGNCKCKEPVETEEMRRLRAMMGPDTPEREAAMQEIRDATSTTESILEEAQRLVYGARAAAYGHPRDNMARIAQIWSVTLGIDVTPRQVALCMIGVKLAREVQTETRDDLVDIAGYAAVADRVAES